MVYPYLCNSSWPVNEKNGSQVNQELCCDFDDFVKAMAQETRQHILKLLQGGEMNVQDLTAMLNLSQPTVSHHLAILENARLVTPRHDGRYTFYRINSDCVAECCSEILNRFNIPFTAEEALDRHEHQDNGDSRH